MTPEQFKTIRLTLGYTQTEMGQQLKKHRNTIADYEKGARAIPYLVEQAMPHLLTARKKG